MRPKGMPQTQSTKQKISEKQRLRNQLLRSAIAEDTRRKLNIKEDVDNNDMMQIALLRTAMIESLVSVTNYMIQIVEKTITLSDSMNNDKTHLKENNLNDEYLRTVIRDSVNKVLNNDTRDNRA